ncbi:hypothetical protein B0H14DRAFT_2321962, partial [Mycena olivaceomarginata]
IVPVPPVKTSFDMGEKSLARTQIPLRLAWAVTVHKSQGLTCKNQTWACTVGLTFVGLLRVKVLSDIMIVGQLDYSRVKNLSGKNLQHRLDDFTRRY